jgi:hypothetical protein
MKKILIILACIMLFVSAIACGNEASEPPVEPPPAEAPQPIEPVPVEPEQEAEQEPEPVEVPEPELVDVDDPQAALFPAYLEILRTRDYFTDSSWVHNEDYAGDIVELPELGVAETISLVSQLLEWSEEAAMRNKIWVAGDTVVGHVTGQGTNSHDVYFDGRAFTEWTGNPEFSGILWEIEPSEAVRLGMEIDNVGHHPDTVYELVSITSLVHDGMEIQIEEYFVNSARTEPYTQRVLFIDGELIGWVQRTITVRVHELHAGADMAVIERFMNMPIADYYLDTSEWGQIVFY